MNYTWPATTFAEKNSVREQLSHIVSEFEEIAEVVIEENLKDAEEKAIEYSVRLFEELADAQHSIETFWRILDRIHGQGFSQRIVDMVRAKNAARGYYVEQVAP